MNTHQRAEWVRSYRAFVASKGLFLSPDDDGVTPWIRVTDAVEEFIRGAWEYGLWSFVCACLGTLLGLTLPGFLFGLAAVAVGRKSFANRPPLGRIGQYLNRMAILCGLPAYDDEGAHVSSTVFFLVFATAVGACLTALVAALIGLPVALCAGVVGAVVFITSAREFTSPGDPEPGPADHGNVSGEADVAGDLPQITQAGLHVGDDLDGGGFFVGTFATHTWEQEP